MISCTEKPGDINQGGGDGTTGKRLVKETWLDYGKRYENNDLQYTSGYYVWTRYVYSGNQLADIMDGKFKNGGPIEESYGMQFIYDGDKLTEIRVNDEELQSNTYLTYSGEQITELYETYVDGGFSGWYKRNMTYSSDGHLMELTETYDGGDNNRYVLTWSGDNVASVQCFENGSLFRTTNYTYDNKKSAYTEMPEWYAYMEDGSFTMLSANNVIMESRVNSDGESRNHSYTYTYDGEWPVKRIENYGNEYYSGILTTYYEYADGAGQSLLPTIYTLKVNENSDGYGYTSGGGVYAAGSTAVMYACPWPGYIFQQWNDGNTQNPRTVTVDGNATYTAIFSSDVKSH